ncbi:MAG: formyltransferase family protein [Gammaproteobacteria bacterium]|jgi:methionyl-tRNA formyltransferase
MSDKPATSKPPQRRVLFFGSAGRLSHAVLEVLLKRNVNVTGVVIPGVEPNKELESIGGIPIVQPANHPTAEQLALEYHLPVIYVQNVNGHSFQQDVANMDPDYILVACFPFKLPQVIFQASRVASLNIHPSLLPAYRGPQPVFWQLKNGEAKTGVSLHLMSEEFDAGDIVIQTEVPLRPGMRGRAIDAKLGEFGARLFLEAMRLYELNNINTEPQSWIQATYMPPPTEKDFEISTQWSARQAFSFLRGTEEWDQPYPVQINGSTVYIKTAMAYSPSASIDQPYVLDDNYITIQFSPGLVNAYIESKT